MKKIKIAEVLYIMIQWSLKFGEWNIHLIISLNFPCISLCCFYLGLNRSNFDNKSVSFDEHKSNEHNMWHYLNFIVLVKVKDHTEFTGPESYVYTMVKVCLLHPDYHTYIEFWWVIINVFSCMYLNCQ